MRDLDITAPGGILWGGESSVYFGSVSQLAGRFLQLSGRKLTDQAQLCFHYAGYQTSSRKPLLKSVRMVFSEGALVR